MGSEVMANPNLEVTIYLVQNLTTELAPGSTSDKKRLISSCDCMDSSEARGHGVPMAEVKAKSGRLRECSQYFATCMSERWAQSKSSSKAKFCLEVQAEVRHYVDCFSRMQFLYKPMASVTDCIELLKVASQIGFQAVVDIGVKYLAAAPWSDDEEKLVREFCSSAHLVPCDSLGDLLVRLEDLPSGVEEKQEKLSLYAMNLLSRYLRSALPDEFPNESSQEEFSTTESAQKFEEAFRLILSASESGAVCNKVVEFAVALVTQESARLFSCVQRECKNELSSGIDVRNALSRFFWLFRIARKSNATQAIVELLLKDPEALFVIYCRFFSFVDRSRVPELAVRKWAVMIYRIFLDVLGGRLFLKTSQRVTLFLEGRWVLCGEWLGVEEAHVSELVTMFITTLPLQQQEECWEATKFHISDILEGPSVEAHAMWISHMVTRRAQHQAELPASSDES